MIVPPTDRATALVVDDDANICRLIASIMQRENFQVDTAADGAEALEYLKRKEYRIVLLDLMMPRVSGYDVMKYLAREQPDMLKRVVVISANHTFDDLPPIARVVRKPFEIKDLVATVQQYYDRD